MNNIKILEEWLKEMDEHFKITHINNTKEREALRFIIQDYKELKTKLQEHICIEAHEQVKQLYVPKSKVKEKLNQVHEEYQKILESNMSLQDKNICTFQHGAMRTVLEELLKEGE